jgi:predicted nucleotidyltransferase
MGAELRALEEESSQQHTAVAPTEAEIASVPWLDERTTRLVRATITVIAHEHPELIAAILFGSIARHDERPLTDAEPSDVDLLLLFDARAGTTRLSADKLLAICASAGRALDCAADAPRDVQIIPATWALAEWDGAFAENVAHDGILLWARGPLPLSLAAVAARRTGAPTP